MWGMKEILPAPKEPSLTTVQEREVDAFVLNAKAPKTRAAYRQSWKTFSEWCAAQGIQPLGAPPKFVAAYLVHLQSRGIRPATMDLFLAAFSYAHNLAEVASSRHHPLVGATRSGIRRAMGSLQRKKAPVTLDVLETFVRGIPRPGTLSWFRTRALLLIGFAGAWRRSELATVHTSDLRWVADERANGVHIFLPRSKADQEGKGQSKYFPRSSRKDMCPCVALESWLRAAGIEDGWVFPALVGRRVQPSLRPISGWSICEIVKDCARRAGLDPAHYGGHSLRAGFITDRLEAGHDPFLIIKQTGQSNLTTLQKYDRRSLERSGVARLDGEPGRPVTRTPKETA